MTDANEQLLHALDSMSELQRQLRERWNERTMPDGYTITCEPSSILAAWATEVVDDFLREFLLS